MWIALAIIGALAGVASSVWFHVRLSRLEAKRGTADWGQ